MLDQRTRPTVEVPLFLGGDEAEDRRVRPDVRLGATEPMPGDEVLGELPAEFVHLQVAGRAHAGFAGVVTHPPPRPRARVVAGLEVDAGGPHLAINVSRSVKPAIAACTASSSESLMTRPSLVPK